jgi:hypothetical protein
MQRRPSMQMLLNNTTVLAGKRADQQCVVQASSPLCLLHEKTAPQTTRPSCQSRCYFKPFCSRWSQWGMGMEKPLVELEFLDPVFHDDGDDEELS